MLLEIKNWDKGEVIYSGEAETVAKLLEQAVKDGIYLYRASLVGARLDGARLVGARLVGARLVGARLVGARLVGASLDESTTIETGETWKQYLSEVIPALLTAGGRALAEVVTAEHWQCHEWGSPDGECCPLTAAFGSGDKPTGIWSVPVLLRPRAEQFLGYFDAKLIPLELVGVR